MMKAGTTTDQDSARQSDEEVQVCIYWEDLVPCANCSHRSAAECTKFDGGGGAQHAKCIVEDSNIADQRPRRFLCEIALKILPKQ